jgi:hypothetical protein
MAIPEISIRRPVIRSEQQLLVISAMKRYGGLNMNRMVHAALFLLLTSVTSLSAVAATYELIPSWKRVDETTNGKVYSYRTFYIDNLHQRVALCFASFTEKTKKLKLECGGLVTLDWKLPKSTQVNSKIVGRFDVQDDDDTIPFGLWQIDESTGDWQFCISGDVGGQKNCVLSHVP